MGPLLETLVDKFSITPVVKSGYYKVMIYTLMIYSL